MNFELKQMLQGSEEWDAMRATRPTASEFGKIFTGGGKPSEQREMYMRRLSIARKYKVPQFTGNEWTERGHALEPEARERLATVTGFDVREAGMCLKNGKFRGCSPDGLIYSNGEIVGGVEIKCFKMDKHLTIVNKGELPTENKPQVHGSLEVTGLKFWLFCLYCPEAFPLDFRIIEVTPDSYTRQLGDALDKFETDYDQNWARYLAEYEVDTLHRTAREMSPIAHSIIQGGDAL